MTVRITGRRRRITGIRLPCTCIDRPLLLFSDTHLLPGERWFGDDDPSGLEALCSTHSEHRVIILGDFLESLVLDDAEIVACCRSMRLASLFSELYRHDARVIIGNHDVPAEAVLRRLFGRSNVVRGPLRVGPLSLVHGHEREATLSGADIGLARWAIPAAAALQRMGVHIALDNSNKAIAASARAEGYLIFGHTHVPELGPTYANTGCFLRRGRRTFITYEGDALTLWEWTGP